jgi:hypothetical protein
MSGAISSGSRSSTVRACGRRVHRERLEAILARLAPTVVLLVANDHAIAGAAQIDRLRAPLVSVTNHRDSFVAEDRWIGIGCRKEFRHATVLLLRR